MTTQQETSSYFVGVDLNTRKIRCLLLDASGEICARSDLFTELYLGIEHIVSGLYSTLREMLEGQNLTWEQVGGIGVALPYNVLNGKPCFCFDKWSGEELAAMIAEAAGVPVRLVSYGMALCLAQTRGHEEARRGGVLGVDIFETLASAGVLPAGERESHIRDCLNVGHMVTHPRGALCACGRRGCLNLMGTGNAAVRYYEELTRQRVAVSELKRRLKAGDVHAAKAMDKCAESIGICILNLLAVFSANSICLGGDFICGNPYLFEKATAFVKAVCPADVQIIRPEQKDSSEAYGAGLFAMKAYPH